MLQGARRFPVQGLPVSTNTNKFGEIALDPINPLSRPTHESFKLSKSHFQ